MKKLFLGIITAAIAGVMCAGFTACDSSVDAKRINGEEVTEYQWLASFDILLKDKATFTVEYSLKSSADYKHTTMVHTTEWGSETTTRVTYTKNGTIESAIGYNEITISGDKIAAAQSVGKAGKIESEAYSVITGSKIYNYNKGKDGNWTRNEAETSVIYNGFGYSMNALKSRYSEFVYSTEHKGYISKYVTSGDSNTTVYKFNGGQLVAIYKYNESVNLKDSVQEYERTSIKSVENVIITYSAKEVVLPIVD